MAEVYAARVRGEAGFQKLVAVKRMLPQLADDDEFTKMFLDEARVAANISSPHCVSTIDLGRAEDGSLYIVMELVVGVTMARLLKWSVKNRRPIPVHVAVELLCQAAHGLHDAHEAATPLGEPLQIIHRDVSPQNVLVGVDGRVRLTDFGVARAVQRMTETVAGRVKGKFAYMSPEQLTAQKIDRRADLFSLGVVSWEFFTGQRLFVGEHPAETMDRVRNMPILTVNEVRPEVPKAVSDVIAWTLERNVEARCPTAREYEENLRQAAVQAGVRFDKDDVVKFVRTAGGTALDKIRNNIKVALTTRSEAGIPEQIDQHIELGLTPSGVQSAVQSVSQVGGGRVTHDTDPESGANRGAAADVDASAPSAAAHPGEVITQLHVPVETADFDPAPRKKGRDPVFLGVAATLIVLLGFGIGLIAISYGEEEAVTTPSEAPADIAPPAAAAVEEAPVIEEEEAAPEPAEPVVAETDAVEVAPATMRRRGDRWRRRRNHMNVVTAAVTPPPTMERPPPVMEAVTAMETHPPRMARPARMSNGLLDLDAFDQGLMR